MNRAVRVKLMPSPGQADALRDTLTTCNAAATHVALVAHKHRDRQGRTPTRTRLHHLVYRDVRARFGLGAQATIRVIAKVLEAYAPAPARQGVPRFQALAGQAFDDRLLSWDHGLRTVSIWTTSGRLKGVRFVGRPSDLTMLATHRRGETDLLYDGGHWYLVGTVELPDAPVREPAGFIGVDMGIVNIATVATDAGEAVLAWSGGAVTARRKRARRLRRRLQATGTKSAKRLLKRRRRKESRYAADVNHRISKSIVAEAQRTGRGIAVEDLVGIRARVRSRRPQRATMHSWSYSQLREYLTYKAAAAGVALIAVDPRGTSQTCSRCGHTAKGNRLSRERFACLACGWSLPADLNAAVNIARRGADGWATAS